MTPNSNPQKLKDHLHRICQQWLSGGLPSRQVMETTADTLRQWKQTNQVHGIWPNRPLMLTATLDDGLGQGLDIIERYADVIGIDVTRLGLLQKPLAIIDQCARLKPDFVGLTVLQLDTDVALAQIGKNLPPATCFIAGGPAFKFDPDMAARCKVDFVASNLAHFVDYLLKWSLQ